MIGRAQLQAWCWEVLQDQTEAQQAHAAHVANFGDTVAVAGRDHAFRTPEAALEEGAELIRAALLLIQHREQVERDYEAVA